MNREQKLSLGTLLFLLILWFILSGSNGADDAYERGEYGVAKELYTQECQDDDAYACYRLGMIFEEAKGMPKDLFRAKELYQQGCSGDNIDACYRLGRMYENGRGIRIDFDKALSIYTDACDDGQIEACQRAATITYQNRDYKDAEKLYSKACDSDHAKACSDLGYIYRECTR